MGASNGGVKQGAGGYAMGPNGAPFGRAPGQGMYNYGGLSGTGGGDPAYPGNSAFGLAGGNGQSPGTMDGGYGAPATGGLDPSGASPVKGGLDPAFAPGATGDGSGYQTGGLDPIGGAPNLGTPQPPQGPYPERPNLGRWMPPQGPYAGPGPVFGGSPQPPIQGPDGSGVSMPMQGGLLGTSPEEQARQSQLGRMSPISYGFRG